MRIILVFAAIWMMSAAMGLAGADKKGGPPDTKKIQGTWKFFEIHRDGKTIKPREVIVRITKDEMITRRKGAREIRCKYHLDTTKDPRHLDQEFTNNGRNRVVRLLYTLKGDTLKICRLRGGGAPKRPTRFEAKPGDSQAIIVLKRIKE